MKTKKVVVGAVAAMLSLSVCSVAPVAVAADDTVQIIVGEAEKKAGEKFTVDVSLADIPSTGIMAIDFALTFDNSVITIDEVKAGALTETGGSDSSAAANAPLFDSSINNDEGWVTLIWSTGLTDSTYWLNGSGVFCTISGTVSSNAKAGDSSEIKVTATDRETRVGSGVQNTDITAGYSTGSDIVRYTVTATNGKVSVPSDTAPEGLRGDANCDTRVNLSDAVLIMQGIANPDVYGLDKPDGITAQGVANADVAGGDDDKGGDGLTGGDAQKIQQFTLKLITEL